jgi:uncharacterized protein YkwD
MGDTGVSYAKIVVGLSCACLAGAVALSPVAAANAAGRDVPATFSRGAQGHRFPATGKPRASCRQLSVRALQVAPRHSPRRCRAEPLRRRAEPLRRRARGPRRGRPALARHTLAALGAARAATLASVLASVLATPCQNTELMPEPGNLPLIRAAVLCLINRVRAQHDERPLRPSAPLEEAAENHSREMISEDYFQHVSPAGVTPVDRLRSAGYIPSPFVGYVIGENIAWGTLDLATPQAIVAAWTASTEHLANILEGQYRDTGIGIAPQAPFALANGVPGATYSQEFGAILG